MSSVLIRPQYASIDMYTIVYILSWKIGPALATGNTVVVKPSEFTPLSALFTAQLVNDAGFPPGVFNLVNGYGGVVGQAMAEHMHIDKVKYWSRLLSIG